LNEGLKFKRNCSKAAAAWMNLMKKYQFERFYFSLKGMFGAF
jgi:hypothetical protein